MSRPPGAPYRDPNPREPAEPPPDLAQPWLVQTWTSHRACPACADPLFAARKDGYRLDACGRCGGVWLSRAEVERTFEERDLTPVQLAEIAARHAPVGSAPPGPRACPDCQKVLTLKTVVGVTIDVCDVDGAWFDAGELGDALRRFVAAEGPLPTPEVDATIRSVERAGILRAQLVEMSKDRYRFFRF